MATNPTPDDQARAVRCPDIEIKRQIRPGLWRVYGHLYWRPFIVVIRGRLIVGRRHIKKAQRSVHATDPHTP